LTETDTDKQLVEQVLGGKIEAFNLLVWRWQRPLYNFLLRLSGDGELARDLSQEAFLRSYQRLKELRDKEKFRSWLFRIAVNLHRSQLRRPTLPVEDSAEIDSLTGKLGQVRPGTQEMQLTLRSLVSHLAPERREVVLLRVFHGFQFDEMAVILDCPVSTLKSRLYKAFAELRAGLESQKPTAGS
jgi:RNA polymerase sigma-70 factor (ECF subfamily)